VVLCRQSGRHEVVVGETGDRIIAPRSAADIAPGDRLQLGEFAVVFAAGAVQSRSEAEWVRPVGNLMLRQVARGPTGVGELLPERMG